MKNKGKRERIVWMLLSLALLSSLSFATTACTNDTSCSSSEVCRYGKCQVCTTSAECVEKTFLKSIPQGTPQPSPWFTIALMAAMIAIFGAGIFFAIGYAFNIDLVKRYGKAELMQAVASLILVVLLFGVNAFGYALVNTIENQTGMITASLYDPAQVAQVSSAGATISVSPFDGCYAFLKNMLDCTENMWKVNLAVSLGNELLANLQLQMFLATPTDVYSTPAEWANFVPQFAKKVAETEYLGDELSWLTIVLYAQISFLRFIETSMFTVFLPIGIILRAFPPTRGAGAVLIAISIGLYIVFPMAYTMLYLGSPKMVQGCNVQIPSTTSIETAACPLAPDSMATAASTAATSSIDLSTNIPIIKSGTSQIKYMAYLYLLISLGTTFIFVRSVSGLLGADISEMGRSMMKLV